ncbi:Crp/Fnr family transcriptional regulator [Spirosoma aureum]|uniref:Crp/Fnr family transcriptional regulator n=1 Tax=Spirosoma aureum TaxID=2692134 RepID=A0A6G9ASE5_9BACT|nr:Crp/Fnr family transcriptional regulator [Spirosoma aureum]QIP15205.1 Crp/Fnr family transcriptional regulator [Spirosoma aureum]
MAGKDDWQAVVRANRKILHVKKGALIFAEGDAVAGVFFVYKGIVKIQKQWARQKQLILNFARSGEMIGYRGLGEEPIFPVSATALEDAAICYIELPFFESALETNHALTHALMKFFANALQAAEKRLRDLALMDVKGRVAETLLMLERKFGIDAGGYIDVSLKQQDMAAYAGTTYETFFRMLHELKAETIIEQDGKRILILDHNRLSSLTQIIPA